MKVRVVWQGRDAACYDVLADRWEADRAGWWATVAGLIRHDLMTRFEQKITAPIAGGPNEQQDHIDAGISGCEQAGSGLQYFSNLKSNFAN